MPSDATITSAPTTSRTLRLGGFVAGVLLSLAAGGLISVAFTGTGLSSGPTPPEQVYFP
ncbi:MAG: hypothetical protein MK107_12480 [Oceanicola sp.]|jgi:hypothetical protein|nr:hypothetical protein [Oceanicola sp.]